MVHLTIIVTVQGPGSKNGYLDEGIALAPIGGVLKPLWYSGYVDHRKTFPFHPGTCYLFSGTYFSGLVSRAGISMPHINLIAAYPIGSDETQESRPGFIHALLTITQREPGWRGDCEVYDKSRRQSRAQDFQLHFPPRLIESRRSRMLAGQRILASGVLAGRREIEVAAFEFVRDGAPRPDPAYSVLGPLLGHRVLLEVECTEAYHDYPGYLSEEDEREWGQDSNMAEVRSGTQTGTIRREDADETEDSGSAEDEEEDKPNIKREEEDEDEEEEEASSMEEDDDDDEANIKKEEEDEDEGSSSEEGEEDNRMTTSRESTGKSGPTTTRAGGGRASSSSDGEGETDDGSSFYSSDEE